MRLWPGLFVAPVVFMIQFPLIYALVPWACSAQNRSVLHALAAIAFAIAAGATVYAGRAWRQTAHARGSDHDDPASRDQFLALVGTVLSALFTFGIAAQWFTQFVVPPCMT